MAETTNKATGITPTFAQAPKTSQEPIVDFKAIQPATSGTDAFGVTRLGVTAQEEVNKEKSDAASRTSEFQPEPDVETFTHTEDDVVFETAMMRPASQHGMTTILQPRPSTYIPNSQMLYAMLQSCDLHMSNTKKWFDNAQGWNPLLSRLYIGVLHVVQTLRAMRSPRTISMDQLRFLNQFEASYHPNHLWIPGPLVPWFTALSVIKPTTGDLVGTVSPAYLSPPGWSPRRHLMAGEDYVKYVPNIPGMMDLYHQIMATRAANNFPAWTPAHPPALQHVGRFFGADMDDTDLWRTFTTTPGLRLALPGDHKIWEPSYHQRASFDMPTPLRENLARIPDTWSSFLRMDMNSDEHRWFGQVMEVMSSYSRFFHFSTTLHMCSETKSGAGLIKLRHIRGTTSYNAMEYTAATHEYKVPNHDYIVAAGEHSAPGLPVFYENMAQVTQLNCLAVGGNEATYRTGPFWTFAPDIKKVAKIDYFNSVATIAKSSFMNEQPVKERVETQKSNKT